MLTPEEAVQYEEERARRVGDLTGAPGASAADFELWHDTGSQLTERRTSLIIDPPSGRIPPRTAGGARRQSSLPLFFGNPHDDSYLDRHLSERCLAARLPFRATPAGNYLQVFQREDLIAILQETNHEARLVPVGTTPIPPPAFRQQLGFSRAQWIGDTLVITTTAFNERMIFQGIGPNLTLVERLTLVDSNTLQYEYTVNDPETFTRPWTVMMVMTRTSDRIYEDACHEGNYSLPLILRGGRAQERATR